MTEQGEEIHVVTMNKLHCVLQLCLVFPNNSVYLDKMKWFKCMLKIQYMRKHYTKSPAYVDKIANFLMIPMSWWCKVASFESEISRLY